MHDEPALRVSRQDDLGIGALLQGLLGQVGHERSAIAAVVKITLSVKTDQSIVVIMVSIATWLTSALAGYGTP